MRTALFILVLCAGLAAQRRSFVVDASNGPGTDFRDLPPALAQAQHGDVYRVRPGLYSPFTTSVGVALLGEPGAIVRPATGTFADTVVVTAVPAGQTFAMRGFVVRHADVFAYGIELNGIAGFAHLEDVTVTYTGTADPGASIEVQACAALTCTRCRGDAYVRFANSWIWLVDCDLRGRDESPLLDARAAISHVLSAGGLSIAGGTFRGGNGLTRPGAPAAILEFSTFFVTGDASTSFFAGLGGSGAPALRIADATLTLEPRVVLVPTGSAPPIQEWRPGTVRLIRRSLPYLSASAAPLTGTLRGTLTASAGDVFLLGTSLVTAPQALYGMRSLVDLSNHVGLGYGVMSGPTLSFAVPVPANPALRACAFAFQAGIATAANMDLVLSNPAVVVVH